jgi:hypothetical protein
MENNYTKACVLRRCGHVDECCPKCNVHENFYDDVTKQTLPSFVELMPIVLDHMWESIDHRHCALYIPSFVNKRCILLGDTGTTYCYPVVSKKRPNRVVMSMFALFCAHCTEVGGGVPNEYDLYHATAGSSLDVAYSVANLARAASTRHGGGRDAGYSILAAEFARILEAWGDEVPS